MPFVSEKSQELIKEIEEYIDLMGYKLNGYMFLVIPVKNKITKESHVISIELNRLSIDDIPF
jgi:hypothetical protein